ncbi:MAG: CopG family transcriptional regulator [Dehalococcoidia bacterium]
MEKTTIYLPEDLKGRLRYLARRRNESEAQVVRDALVAWVTTAEEDQPLPQWVGSINEELVPGVSSSNAKSWIRENWARDIEAHEKEPLPDHYA